MILQKYLIEMVNCFKIDEEMFISEEKSLIDNNNEDEKIEKTSKNVEKDYKYSIYYYLYEDTKPYRFSLKTDKIQTKYIKCADYKCIGTAKFIIKEEFSEMITLKNCSLSWEEHRYNKEVLIDRKIL